MDKINFMISSFLSLLILTSFASATPNDFQRMTGIETDRISEINFSDFGFKEENVVADDKSCPRIEVIGNSNVEFENESIVKTSGSDTGWFTINTSEMDYLIVEANDQGFFQFERWIGYEGYTEGNLVNFGTISGGNNRIALFENEFGFTDYENITIYSDDAEVESLSNQCRFDARDDTSQGLVTNLTSTVSDSIQSFVQVLGGFLGVLNSIVSALIVLLTAKGNAISTTVMKIFVGAQLLGWLYILTEFIKDVIPFT